MLISRSAEFHRIATYLSRYTSEPIGIILSIGLLNELFKKKWSENLPGGILESFGRLFKDNVQLYVYPWHNTRSKELVTAENFRAPASWGFFYRHLLENNRIRAIGVGDPSLLAMTSRKTLKLIESGEAGWEQWVPQQALEPCANNRHLGKANKRIQSFLKWSHPDPIHRSPSSLSGQVWRVYPQQKPCKMRVSIRYFSKPAIKSVVGCVQIESMVFSSIVVFKSIWMPTPKRVKF